MRAVIISLAFLVQLSFARQTGKIAALRNELLNGYEKDAKPEGKVDVKFSLRITHMDLCGHEQKLSWNGWLLYMWNDERLAWNATEFGGLDRLRIHSKNIWIPDITVYNSIGEPKPNYLAWDSSSNAVVMSNGLVIFVPPVAQKTYCKPNYANWPWGEQNCTVKVGSWTYHMEELDIHPYLKDTEDFPESAMNFGEFLNAQIKISDSHTIRNEKEYDCCPGEMYPSMTMSVAFTRTEKFVGKELMTP